MKTFLQFISEAETQASTQAKNMGLSGNGHGDWYDKQGKLAAKTIGGRLKFFGNRNAGQKIKPVDLRPQKREIEEPQKNKGDSSLTVSFGRFNPPHIGHEKLLNKIKQTAGGDDYRIYPSRSEGDDRNPLDAKDKIELMKSMFPDYAERIVDDDKQRTIFDVLKGVHKTGVTNINVVVGADRYKEFKRIANDWNGKEGFWNFKSVNVVNAGERDPKSKGVEGASASKMRDAAISNRWDDEYYPDDYKDKDLRGKVSKQGFSSLVPKGFDKKPAKKLFTTLRDKLGSKKVKEMWRIAPSFDMANLRENFISGKLFQVDDMVENDHTGLVGKIIRKGTNYVIAVTEDNIMFKSWIKDLNEYTEVHMSSTMRDATHPNTLVGTDGYRKNLEKLTPGQYPLINKLRQSLKKSEKK